MKVTRIIILGAVVLALGSCALLNEEQKVSALAAVDRMLTDGVITKEQAEALRVSITGGSFNQFLVGFGTLLGSVAGSLFGVRVWRGPINARRGAAPAPAPAPEAKA